MYNVSYFLHGSALTQIRWGGK